jgi:glycosyltransferase involved in cell wall biosynthesis
MPTIHLINPMWDCAGSEWRTFELHRQLSPHTRVNIWSQARPSPMFASMVPIRRLRPELLRFPFGGTLVFVGVYARIGRWIRFAQPRRIIIVYNTDVPGQLARQVAHVQRGHHRPVEFVFASEWLRQSVSGIGPVQVSPINLERFSPVPAAERRFTVGRHSRDAAKKHHPDDPALYRRLVQAGARIRLLGGTVLSPELSFPTEDVELLPTNAIPAEDLLQSIDCFFYRTAPGFREPHGRVVQEAMSCGLPVVCHRHGGYAEYIDHGQNGFLFDTDDEAFALLTQLQHDLPLRRRVGAAARATIERLFSPAALQEVTDFYLRD